MIDQLMKEIEGMLDGDSLSEKEILEQVAGVVARIAHPHIPDVLAYDRVIGRQAYGIYLYDHGLIPVDKLPQYVR